MHTPHEDSKDLGQDKSLERRRDGEEGRIIFNGEKQEEKK